MSELFGIMKKTGLRYRTYLFANIIALTIVAAASVYSNRLIGDLSETVTIGDMDVLIHLLLLVTILRVVRGVFGGASDLYIARFGAFAGYNLRQTFIKHFLHAPFAKVEESGSGESLSIFSNDTPASERLAAKEFLSLVRDFANFAASFAFLLFISPFYTGVSLAAAAVLMVFVIVISQPMQKYSKKVSEKEAGFNAVVNDSLQNISTIAAYSLHDVLERRYLDAFYEYVAMAKRFIVVTVLMVVVSFMSMLGPLVLIFIILGFAVINGNLYLTDFVAFSLTITFSAMSLLNFAMGVGRFREHAGRAKRYLDSTSHEHERDVGDIVPEGAAGLLFKDVTFSYKEDLPAALEVASFEIEPGSKVALVGGSGSGKSTALKLLMGLYEPAGGEILLGGQDITKIGKKALRNMFSYVPQDSFLFPVSIGKNITLEDDLHDADRLKKACADAGILEFIESLPNKFDNELVELAENISGGQRQRIAMARAFYKNADIILFDEATSSLDPKTESEVLGNLFAATEGKTVIMVAHRAMSITSCDKIIVMDKGKICHVGTHDELIKTSPVYKNLYAKNEVAA